MQHEILDFWHALEQAWAIAQLGYGEGSAQADAWVPAIAEDLRAGKVPEVIGRLKRLRPKNAGVAGGLAGAHSLLQPERRAHVR